MTAMTCERFEAMVPDYLEGELTDEARLAADAHANACGSCAAIVADLTRITREAAALPPMHPSRDLWAGIEARISAPVIPLAHPPHAVTRRFASTWIAAAAAALVVTTAGITYLSTSRIGSRPPERVASIAAKPVTAIVDSSALPEAPAVTAPSTDEAPSQAIRPKAQPSSATLASNNVSPRRALVKTAAAGALGSTQADVAYDHEIDILERMVNSANSGLDTATVQVVKKNLRVIDDAIAQSKAALAKDPASAFLLNQMTRAMGKKIELLRTMASLSSSS